MLFALDHDGTWSADPALFADIVRLIESHGHRAVMVTRRPPDDPVPVEGIKVYYTDGMFKQPWAAAHDLPVDVWVDDNPYAIVRMNVRERWVAPPPRVPGVVRPRGRRR